MNDFYSKLDGYDTSCDRAALEAFLLRACAEGETPLRVAAFSELGGYYRSLFRLDESLAAFENALGLILDYTSEKGLPYATALLNHAGTLRLLSRRSEAEAEFLEALELLSGEPGGAYARASAKNNLSLVYADEGKLALATKLANEALLELLALGGCEEELATCEANLAALLLRGDEAARAKEQALRALSRFSALAQTSRHEAACRQTLALALRRLGEEEAAAAELALARELNRAEPGPNTRPEG